MDCIFLPSWSDIPSFWGAERRLPCGRRIDQSEKEWLSGEGISLFLDFVHDQAGDPATISDPVLLVHGVGVRRFSRKALSGEMKKRDADILVLGYPADRPGARLLTAPDGRLKALDQAVSTNLADSGVWLARRDILLPRLPSSATPSDMLSSLLREGARIHVESPASFVGICSSPVDFLILCTDILSGSVPGFLLPESARRGILIGEDARISPDADLLGLCWVAAGASIGDGCRIENSVILENAGIGEGASVRNAIVLPGALVKRKTDLSDKYIKVIGG